MNELGERVMRYRIDHGLTQAQMAKKCNVSVPTIAELENQKKYRRPNFLTIKKIESVLMEEKEHEAECNIDPDV